MRELVDAGMRVSIDTFDVDEIRVAVRAGASLVLSVNQSNIEIAKELASSPVDGWRFPISAARIDTLEPTIAKLDAWGVSYLSTRSSNRSAWDSWPRSSDTRMPVAGGPTPRC